MRLSLFRKTIRITLSISIAFILGSSLGASEIPTQIVVNPGTYQIQPKAHNPSFRNFPEQSFYSDREGWGDIIDSTWGSGMSYGEKLTMFNEYADALSDNFPLYHRFPKGWEDSVRTHYYNQITENTSRGAFCAIMQYFALAHREGHTYAYDYDVFYTPLNPGTPLLVLGGLTTIRHFGAVVTPQPDKTILVLRVVDNHPLGLEPGDIILGYEGVPWHLQVEELLEAQLPLIMGTAGAESAFNRGKLVAVGMNWHLFDSIDIIKYGSGDTLHLATAPMISLELDHISNNEQLPVPGIELPTLFRYDISGGPPYYQGQILNYGIIDGTNIGYIYVMAEVSTIIDGLFYEAIDALRDTDGIILDFRYNQGGWALYEDAFDYLFNSTFLPFVDVYRCSQNTYDLCWPDASGEDYWTEGSPTSFYDRPIAFLVGHNCVSMGDVTAYWFKHHPNTRFFGHSSSASPGYNVSIGPGFLAGPGQWHLQYTISDMIDLPGGQNLGAEELEVDDDVWFTPEDVAQGIDTPVEHARTWIEGLAYAHDMTLNKNYGVPGQDSILVSVQVDNRGAHGLDIAGTMVNIDSTFLTEFLVNDNGTAGDLLANDDIWSAYVPVPTIETSCRVSIDSYDQTLDWSHHLPNVQHFTTMGPVVPAGFSYFANPEQELIPGQMTMFKFNLQNLGLDSTIRNVSVTIHPEPRWLTSAISTLSFGDIVPADTVTSTGNMGINLDPTCHSQTIPVRVDIYSDGILFWSSELTFDVNQPVAIEAELPEAYALYPPYPNPFNPSTTISYDLPEQSDLSLIIYDVTGREVTIFQNQDRPAGSYKLQWNGTDGLGNPVSAGVYIARLTVGDYANTIKMVYLK